MIAFLPLLHLPTSLRVGDYFIFTFFKKNPPPPNSQFGLLNCPFLKGNVKFGSYRRRYEDCCLLGCVVMCLGKQVPAFRINYLPSSSEQVIVGFSYVFANVCYMW